MNRKLKINEPQYDIAIANRPRNLMLTGQGGGKTFDMGLISYYLIKSFPQCMGMICANTYGQLSDSTLLEIYKVWKEYFDITEYDRFNPTGSFVIGKEPPPHFVKHGHTFQNNHNKIFFANGAVVMVGSLDNYKMIEGRTLGWVLLDETSDTREEAIKEVIGARLRQNILYPVDNPTLFNSFTDIPNGNIAVNPMYVFTKPSKELWLTQYFNLDDMRTEILSKIFSKTDYFHHIDDRKCVVIASTWHNVDNVGIEYIRNRLADLSPDLAEMYVYGSPFGKTGAEYYNSFKAIIHVGETEVRPDLPIHISFDFNVNPYMTMLVCQVDDENVLIHQEYAMRSPKNTIEDTIDKFLDEWGHLLEEGLYYYGDATGKNTIPSREVRSFYKIIETNLSEYTTSKSRRLLTANPTHKSKGYGTMGRREFMNMFLRGKYGHNIIINPQCKLTIQDMEHVKEDANGAKLKEMALINNVRCQKYGHMSDALDALITYIYGNYNRES